MAKHRASLTLGLTAGFPGRAAGDRLVAGGATCGITIRRSPGIQAVGLRTALSLTLCPKHKSTIYCHLVQFNVD